MFNIIYTFPIVTTKNKRYNYLSILSFSIIGLLAISTFYVSNKNLSLFRLEYYDTTDTTLKEIATKEAITTTIMKTTNESTIISHSSKSSASSSSLIPQKNNNTNGMKLAIELAVNNNNNNGTSNNEYNSSSDIMVSLSLVLSDIESIYHTPDENKIVVQLLRKKDRRKCWNPRLLGRLSGPSLSIIQWENQQQYTIPTVVNQEENNNEKKFVETMIGYYSVSYPGQRYYIEIISLLCNDFTFDASYKNVCIENPAQHHVTSNNAYIDTTISNSSTIEKEEEIIGSWKWKNDTTSVVPLYTRYQPQYCNFKTQKQLYHPRNYQRCLIQMSYTRFNSYVFEFSDKKYEQRVYQKLLVEKKHVSPSLKICVVGSSHARFITRELNSYFTDVWNITTKKLEDKIGATHLEAKFTHNVNISQVISKQTCHKVIFAIGQWLIGDLPTSHPRHNRTRFPIPTFAEYYKMIESILLRRQIGMKKNGMLESKHMYLRSLHYNPLGDVKTMCPPKDWRSPPTIDMFNDILRTLAKKYDLPFIDTNFIYAPMWDAAEDWCHHRTGTKVSKAEALYILDQILF